jgi:putative phosphoribosyl transferase
LSIQHDTGHKIARNLSRKKISLTQSMNTSATPSSILHVRVPCPRGAIHGELAIPDDAKGLVIVAHATDGGWTSSKNWPIAWKLHQSGFATLLLDLLTPVEAGLESAKGFLRFEVPLLTERLEAATHWALTQKRLEGLPCAYFASDAAAAAAIEAAVDFPAIRTIVCRAARTDLVGSAADRLKAPVLLIVGEHDRRILRWNREFMAGSRSKHRVEIIKDATHRFTQEGAHCDVARITANWLNTHLPEERVSPEDILVSC